MRLVSYALCAGVVIGLAHAAHAADAAKTDAPPPGPGAGHIEVTADKSLEWYQDQRIYVARGNARAVRGEMTIEADILTAHERDQPLKPGAGETKAKEGAKAQEASNASNAAASPASSMPQPSAPPPLPGAAAKPPGDSGAGDIDKMTAEGHVRVTTPKALVTGDHGVYDLIRHVAYVTGGNLKYQTPEQVVTAKDSLEYWEDKKIAVARGDAVAIRGDRHVEGDVLTAQFRDMPNGKSQLHTLTADGHVVVITANDVSRAEHAVYDINRNIAILTKNVRITRADGTQLTGDVGEVDFAANQSRLLNEGTGRVRALLTQKASPKKGKSGVMPVSAPAGTPQSASAP